MEERDVVINIESCLNTTKESVCPDESNDKFENTFSKIDELARCQNSGNPSADSKNVPSKSEKRLSLTAKKPPKPPRPPRGLSLDAADQKLIKEISELAMLKRARNERMKALKKNKAAKASSPGSSSSSGNLIAMAFTVLFCIVIIFQGCHPSRSFLSSSNSSAGGIVSSRKPNGATEGNIGGGVGPPSFMEIAPAGLDNKGEANEKSFH